jgi:predicted transcriptional regulator
MLKDEIKRMIDDLLNDSSMEDIQYHLYVHSKIKKGLDDMEKGNVVAQNEMEKRMVKWLSQ